MDFNSEENQIKLCIECEGNEEEDGKIQSYPVTMFPRRGFLEPPFTMPPTEEHWPCQYPPNGSAKVASVGG